MTSAASFERRKSIYKNSPKVLVICEDSKSCKTYLEDASHYLRSHAAIKVSHCGKTNPLGIVEEAVALKNKYEKIFCVLDRDTHERWDEALRLAKSNGILVVASFPCYEYWLLLHFRFTRRDYVREGDKSPADVVVRELRAESGMQKYDKGKSINIFNALLPRLHAAKRHAAQGLEQARGYESELNPSTQLHELLAEFEKLGVIRCV